MHFEFAYLFLFLSYSFGIETIKTFIHSRNSLETIPDSRPKWPKCISVFTPKRGKNPTRWGGTYLYGLYKRVPPRRKMQVENHVMLTRKFPWIFCPPTLLPFYPSNLKIILNAFPKAFPTEMKSVWRCYFIVFLREFLSRLSAENVGSEVADVTGIVRYIGTSVFRDQNVAALCPRGEGYCHMWAI